MAQPPARTRAGSNGAGSEQKARYIVAIRPMKFWEVHSAFRDDTATLDEVFGSDKWRTAYFEAYSQFDDLVQKQDRAILDALLPLELTHEIAARYHKVKFHFSLRDRILRVARPGYIPGDDLLEMTALEVHDQFGGSVIEEVFERGLADIAADQ